MGTPENRRRILLAQEAARLMVEEGVNDYGGAKRKATRRLGGGARRDLPKNREIQEEVELRLRMYRDEAHSEALLTRLRGIALEAMALFAAFRPRLVGSVLSGLATEHSDINIHLFADTVEDVEIALHDLGINFERGSGRLRMGARIEEFPTVILRKHDILVVATVFSPEGIRQAPHSPVTGRPVERAKRAQVEALLGEGDSQVHPLIPGAARGKR